MLGAGIGVAAMWAVTAMVVFHAEKWGIDIGHAMICAMAVSVLIFAVSAMQC